MIYIPLEWAKIAVLGWVGTIGVESNVSIKRIMTGSNMRKPFVSYKVLLPLLPVE